jgi:hypothetical protein
MRHKTFILLFVVSIVVTTSFGQGFVACLIDAEGRTDACKGGNPLPDSTIAQIWLDRDPEGPSASDTLAPMGADGFLNWNTFPINWAGGEIPGGFYTDPCLSSGGMMPANGGRYYVKLALKSGLTWTSESFKPTSGFGEYYLKVWTCSHSPASSAKAK